VHKKLPQSVYDERRSILETMGFDTRHLGYRQMIPTKTVIVTLVQLEQLGYSTTQVRSMVRRTNKFLFLGMKLIMRNWWRLRAMGFSHAETLNMAYDQPCLLTDSTGRYEATFQAFLDWGFGWNDPIKIFVAVPRALVWSWERTSRILNRFVKAGFTKDEVCRMVFAFPELITDSYETVCRHLDGLKGLGVGAAGLRTMILARPDLLRKNLDRAQETMDILRFVKADPVKRASSFGFSAGLLRGRIVFLSGRGQGTWPGSLFESNPIFNKRFCVTREQMVTLDPGPEEFKRRFVNQ
jgi:hypothetical protein